MTIPSSPSFDNIPNSVQELLKGYRTQQKVLRRAITDVKNTTKFVNKNLIESGKLTKELKEINDKVLSKVPGGSGGNTPAAKASRLSGLIGALFVVGGAAFILKLGESVQAAQEKVNDRLSNDLSKALSSIQLVTSQVKTANTKIKSFEQQDQRTRDRIYALEKQFPGVRENANNALYETRKGREIVEAKIVEAKKQANDALYETREGRKILESKITDIRTKIDTQFEAFKTQLETLKSKLSDAGTVTLTNLKTEVDKIRINVSEAIKKNESTEKKFDALPPTIISIQKELAKIKPDEIVGTTIKYVDGKIAEIRDILKKDIQPKIEAQGKEIKDIGSVTVTSYEGVTKSLKDAYNLSFEAGAAKWNEDIRKAQAEFLKTTTVTVEQSVTTTSAQTAQQIEKLKTEIKTDLNQQTKELEKLKSDLQQTKQAIPSPTEINNLKIQTGNLSQKIPQLEKDIKDQKKVNDQAIPKLDEIVGKLGFIPALTANAIRPDIPTLPQIESATGTAMCKSMNGGCSGKALNDQTNNIKDAVNQANNNLLDQINTGANAAQLTLLGTINNKLGDQVTGGISGKLDRFSKWLHLDRLLNMMIFATTVHNAFQLSNDIATTLGSALSNILGLIGLKDDTGSNIDIGQIINSTVENLVKGIVGEENYQSINAAWQKANRIYQASTNVLNNLMNVNSVITNALEVIGSYTGKIGNALRLWGVVGEKAYSWMNPQPSFDNKWMTKLQQLQEGANTVAIIAQIPVDAVNAVTELNNSATEFVKAVKQEPETKDGLDVGEAAKVKAERDAAKIASYVPAFDISDLFDGDD